MNSQPFLMYNNSMEPIEKSFLLIRRFWWMWLENNFTFLGRLDVLSQPDNKFQMESSPRFDEFRWYASDVTLLGYKYCDRKRPLFWAYNPHTKMSVLRAFNMEEAEKEMQILESLANPDLLPLCLNTWATSFAAEYFARK